MQNEKVLRDVFLKTYFLFLNVRTPLIYIESVKKAITGLHQAFPDFSLTIEDTVINGDKVWGRMIGRGTHQNQFGPLSPTGKKFEITVIDIMRFKNNASKHAKELSAEENQKKMLEAINELLVQ